MKRKILACAIAIAAFASCTKNDPRSAPARQDAKQEPYVTRDGNEQDWTGWSIWDNVKKECVGTGKTCAPEVVIEYKMDFWDHIMRAWYEKCTEDPYWGFSGEVKDDPSLSDLIADPAFRENFCEVQGIALSAYDEMTLGQFFKFIFPTATDQIMAKLESGNYAVQFMDSRGSNGRAYLMACPKGSNPAINPEFVLQLKF